MSNGYWDKVLNRRMTRRRALAATGATAATAAFLAACGGGDDDDDDSGPSDSGGAATPSGGGGGTATTDTGPSVGGHLIWQGYGDPGGGLELIKSRNAGVNQMASLTHDSLLDFAYGLPDYPGIGIEVLPNLAVALPEISPDKLTATFKIHENVKFHDGKPLTSEDLKWTYETMAFAEESARKRDLSWIDSVEAPDATTFVMHSKFVNADFIQTMAYKNHAGVLHREHHESGAAENSFLGSGPYLFEEYSPPTVMRYKRNPDYWRDDAGWFESIDRLGTSDSEKKVADIISGQVHVTYWFPAEERERIKAARDDLLVFQYPRAGSGQVYIRNDVPPFNDKRVRHAMSMAYDRQILIDSVTEGEGQPDQQLSRSGTAWGFRGPEDLPRADLYELNVAEAKKLLAAANVEAPIQVAELPTWNATVIGQKFLDEITLITTQWRSNGIVDAQLKEETFGQFGPRFTGQYDTMHWGPNTQATRPTLGKDLYDKYYAGGSAPDGPPTLNICYLNNPEVDDLLVKQLEEFDVERRKELFRELEDVLVEVMAHNSGVTGQLAWFIDPVVKNAQMPRDAYNGSVAWMKYWYMGEA